MEYDMVSMKYIKITMTANHHQSLYGVWMKDIKELLGLAQWPLRISERWEWISESNQTSLKVSCQLSRYPGNVKAPLMRVIRGITNLAVKTIGGDLSGLDMRGYLINLRKTFRRRSRKEH